MDGGLILKQSIPECKPQYEEQLVYLIFELSHSNRHSSAS